MIGVIIQARSGSKRFPKKIYADIAGKTLIERVCNRVSEAKVPHKVILAMPREDEEGLQREVLGGDLFTDPPLRQMGEVVERLKVDAVYFGDEKNVLSRYYEVARYYGLDTIVRITGDCLFVMPELIDEMLLDYNLTQWNGYMYNGTRMCQDPYPKGFDIEIFPYWALCKAHMNAEDDNDREHVTWWMWHKKNVITWRYENIEPHITLPFVDKNFSLDEPEDLPKFQRMYQELLDGKDIRDILIKE